MSKLVVLSGVPGSGKSYFSSSLRSYKKAHVYIVSSDALRNLILGNQQDMSEDKMMWKMYYKLAYVYSADPDGIVVLDATHTSSKFRIESTKMLKPLFNEIDLVYFDLPKEVVIKQNREREFPVPEDVLIQFINKFEIPDELDRNYFKHVYIVKSHNIDDIIKNLSDN